MVGQQLGIVGGQGARTPVGAAGFGVTLQCGERTRQHGPGLVVAGIGRGLGLQALRKFVHHGFDLRHRHLARRPWRRRPGLRQQRLRITHQRIDNKHEQRDEQAQPERRLAGAPGHGCRFAGLFFLQRPAFDLDARQPVLLRIERAGTQFGVQRRQLFAQHGQVGAPRIDGTAHRRNRPLAPQQAGQQQQQGERYQADKKDQKHVHDFSAPSSSRARARCACSGLQVSVCPARRRRRMLATSTNAASSNSANGPTHNNTVLALSGGR